MATLDRVLRFAGFLGHGDDGRTILRFGVPRIEERRPFPHVLSTEHSAEASP